MIGRQTRQTRYNPIAQTKRTYPVNNDHPEWGDWGAALGYTTLDNTVKGSLALLAERKRGYGLIEPKHLNEPKTDIWWARRILGDMVDAGKAPKKANMSLNCIETICLSEWVWDRIAQHGVEVDRGEIERRRGMV